MGRITAFLAAGTRVEISNERHRWFADEPVEAGGTDAGPTPYDLLLGALAACTTLTLSYYTAHKGIPIAWVKAEYDFDRVHALDCEQCEEADEGMIERVTAHVTIGGNFSEAQQHRLRQIVSRCPVHKSLTHGIRIFDNVAFAPESEGPASA
jgi:putative redox protein